MKRFVPYEKLSKKARHELNGKRRQDWGQLNPVSRRPPDPKIYNRKKHQRMPDGDAGVFIMPFWIPAIQFCKKSIRSRFSFSF